VERWRTAAVRLPAPRPAWPSVLGGEWARPGSAASPTTRPLTTGRLQSKRPGRLVAGRTHDQGSLFAGVGISARTSLATTSQADRGQPERGGAERKEADPVHMLALFPALLVADLVELAARRRAPVRAEPRVFLGGELHLPLVAVIDDRDKPHQERSQADSKCEAEHDDQLREPLAVTCKGATGLEPGTSGFGDPETTAAE
jgi:hypothetical protein